MKSSYSRYLSTIVLLSSFLLGVAIAATPKVHAMPAYADCGATCYSWTGWDGTVYGAYGYVGTTGLGVPFNLNDATLQRFLAVWGGKGGTDVNSNIHAGEEIDQPATGLCNLSHNYKAAYFFVSWTNTSGLPGQPYCWPMPSGDANQPMGYKLTHMCLMAAVCLCKFLAILATATLPIYPTLVA